MRIYFSPREIKFVYLRMSVLDIIYVITSTSTSETIH